MASRIKPTTLQCIAIFLDRRHRTAINFIECGSSGFGDRMRGVAYALFLAKKHGAHTIHYSQSEDDPANSQKSGFPFRMVDLITIDGLEFVPFRLPIALDTATYVHYSQAGNPLKRYGFSEMPRVRPAKPAVADRVAEFSRGGPFLALHVRGTDARDRYAELENPEEKALASIRAEAERSGVKRVYLAAGNKDSHHQWVGRLADAGYEVVRNETQYDSTRLRQTGADDMMVDFFALASSVAIFRTVPSEFSRFAASIGGNRLRYVALS